MQTKTNKRKWGDGGGGIGGYGNDAVRATIEDEGLEDAHHHPHAMMQGAPLVCNHYCTIEEEGWSSDGLNVTNGSSQI